MNTLQIEKQCKAKEQELLSKYFGNLIHEAAIERPEGIQHAYEDATRRTLWERLTKTNHKDVTFYKGLLEEYARELLLCLRCDFIEDISVIE